MNLKSHFNHAARASYLPEHPKILVNTVGDDCNRGDSHAYIGIAKIIAHKLGGDYQLITEGTLRVAYPGLPPAESINLYYRDTGVPDIIFSRMHHCHYKPEIIAGDAPKQKLTKPYVISEINEDLSKRTRFSSSLVSHHITPALLVEHGEKLLETYPGIKSNLITVMMADAEYFGLAENLFSRLKDVKDASIFVCSGRRTDSGSLNLMMDSLRYELDQSGRENEINLLHYDFRGNLNSDAFNPYIGLIDKSDHIIICGDSYSIVSETLCKQQAVYMSGHNMFFMDYMPLMKDGLVKIFNTANKHEALVKTPINVPNTTEATANRVISGYKRHLCLNMGLWRGLGAYLMG